MSLTPSSMIPLGTKAANFKLFNVINDLPVSPIINTPLVLAFICNHCPYVEHIIDELVKVGNIYHQQGLTFIAISSNDVARYPDDGPQLMKSLALSKGFLFPYCFDETQAIAKSYDAACTPDFYLFNSVHELIYRGQFDDSRPSNSIPVTGKDLTNAINNMLAGKPIDENQVASVGCNIKWKA